MVHLRERPAGLNGRGLGVRTTLWGSSAAFRAMPHHPSAAVYATLHLNLLTQPSHSPVRTGDTIDDTINWSGASHSATWRGSGCTCRPRSTRAGWWGRCSAVGGRANSGRGATRMGSDTEFVCDDTISELHLNWYCRRNPLHVYVTYCRRIPT